MLKYDPKLGQNIGISLNSLWRAILKLTSAQSFHSTDVELELLWFLSRGVWEGEEKGSSQPTDLFFYFYFLQCWSAAKLELYTSIFWPILVGILKSLYIYALQ